MATSRGWSIERKLFRSALLVENILSVVGGIVFLALIEMPYHVTSAQFSWIIAATRVGVVAGLAGSGLGLAVFVALWITKSGERNGGMIRWAAVSVIIAAIVAALQFVPHNISINAMTH